jgi:dipeptidyl aminopeptidase/acylaminoacyl peptidase
MAPIVALLVVGLLLPTAASAAPTAQDATPPVTITSARALPTVVGDRNVWMPALSPDGAFLAYVNQDGGNRGRDGQLCVYTFSNAGKRCDVMGEGFESLPYQLQWSPDSTQIAFSENPIELGMESDIWTYDVASQTFTNLTDDGLSGMWRWLDTEEEINLDYLPMWDLTDGSLVFWRVTPLGGFQFDLTLNRIDAAGGDPVELRSVGDAFPAALPTFRNESLTMDGPSMLAPDGSAVAAIMSSPQSVGPVLNSLVLIPLDAEAEVQELLTTDMVAEAIPAWNTWPAATTGLSWTGDSAGIVTLSSAWSTQTPFVVLHYTDVATGDVTPLVDFSAIESPQAYFDLADGSNLPWRAYSPWAAGITSNEDGVLMVNDLGGTTGVFAAMLPPDGGLPTVIGSRQSTSSALSGRSSHSSDGKVVIYGNLLQTETP